MNTRWLLLLPALSSMVACTGHIDRSPVGSNATPSSRLQCEQMASNAIDGGRITKASWVAGSAISSSNTSSYAYCLIEGEVDVRRGEPAPVSGSKTHAVNPDYGIHFELRLPEVWEQRFLYQGGGGSDGIVLPAVGTIPSLQEGEPALARGFAVVSSDAGHTVDQNAGFGVDPKARVDYGYASIGRVTPLAKDLISQFYGEKVKRSYFAGCSKGGQEALQAMQRYSEEFDGIIAGDPGLHLPRAAIAQVADTQIFAQASPVGENGKPQLAAAFSDQDLKLLSRSVRAACGNSDGLRDGFDYRPDQCHFEPSTLLCKSEKNDACLSQKQVAALGRVFAGATSSSGKILYSSWPYDSGIGSANWRGWKLGDAQHPSRAETLGAGSMQYVFSTPPRPTFDIYTVSVDDLARSIAATTPRYADSAVAFMYADSVNLDPFKQRGGKLILYHGGSDPVFSVLDTIDYFKRISKAYGEQTGDFAKMYVVPGMNHCSGGDYALDSFDSLDALVTWVEKGVAPREIVAHAGSKSGAGLPAGMTRPLCPYPQTARYVGGDQNKAASFTCSGA